MIAYQRVIDALREHGCAIHETGHGKAAAQAPGHSPQDRSVVVTAIEGSVLVCSHSDPTSEVLATLGLTKADLYDNPKGETYRYAGGRRVHRSPDKRFRQSGNVKDPALFHVEKLADHPTGLPVYVVEGEKDVLALEAAGATAVSPAMGAGKAAMFDWTPLRGHTVIIVADKDDNAEALKRARKHAVDIQKILEPIAGDVVVVETPFGKDAADHVAAGRTLQEFLPIELPASATSTDPSDDEYHRPRVWRATELEAMRRIEYLAANRLPLAAVAYMLGPEGIGKSLWTIWLVAHITTGRPFLPFGIPARAPQYVVLVLTEDDWSTVARPRLEVAGADLDYVRVICAEKDGSGSPTFPRDMDVVREAAADAVAVIVDAWADTLPGSLSVKDPQQARQALHPWKELATRTGTSILLTGHTNREKGGNVRNAYGLTGELRKKARMTILAQPDPDEEGVLVIGPEKSNLTAPVPASRFKIESVQVFDKSEDSDGTVPRLVWIGDAEQSARDFYTEAATAEDGEGQEDRNEAEVWLEDYLAQHGRTAAKDVKNSARKDGISERTLKRAAQKLGVVYTTEGFPRTSRWELPSRANEANSLPISPESGPTGPTGPDQQKRDGPTGPKSQWGHGQEHGPTDQTPGTQVINDAPTTPTVHATGRSANQWLKSGTQLSGDAA